MTKKLLLAALFANACLAPAVAMADADTVAPIFDPALYVPMFWSKDSLRTGLPYSATETTQVLRTLADGNDITTVSVQRLYRDSAGRLRREKLNSSGGIQSVEITSADGVVYVLDPERKTVRKPAVVVLSMEQSPQGPVIKAGGESAPPEFVASMNAVQTNAPPTPSGASTQFLGTRDMDGCKASGSLSRYEMPVGMPGSSKSIEATMESWVCAELGVTLYNKQSDTLNGHRTVVISQINRKEPDAALFVVPADYTQLVLAGQAGK